jgi:hypothetical protein
MIGEQWLPIPSFPGYMISGAGRVYSLKIEQYVKTYRNGRRDCCQITNERGGRDTIAVWDLWTLAMAGTNRAEG